MIKDPKTATEADGTTAEAAAAALEARANAVKNFLGGKDPKAATEAQIQAAEALLARALAVEEYLPNGKAAKDATISEIEKAEADKYLKGGSKRIDLTTSRHFFHTSVSSLNDIHRHTLWMNYTDDHHFDRSIRSFDDIDYGGDGVFEDPNTKVGYFKQIITNSGSNKGNVLDQLILHPGKVSGTAPDQDITPESGKEFIFQDISYDKLGLNDTNHGSYFNKSTIYIGSIILEFEDEYPKCKGFIER